MPNHFHLILQTTERSCEETPAFGGKPMHLLASGRRILLSGYTQRINKETGRTNSLFQHRTKAKPVLEIMQDLKFGGTLSQNLIRLMQTIHQKPVREGLVSHLEDCQYSSFQDYAGLGNGTLCKRKLLKDMTAFNPQRF